MERKARVSPRWDDARAPAPLLDSSVPSRRLDLGNPVRCGNAPFGELADVVIDPTTRCVTHLVVQPHKRPDKTRIVPVDLATRQGPDPSDRVHLWGR